MLLGLLPGDFIVKIREWWRGLSKRQHTAAFIGLGMLGIGILAGGIMLQAALGGLIINTLLWVMIRDSEWAMNLMQKYGGKIDAAITLVGLLGGGGAATAWLTAVMIGGFFTVFRILIAGGATEPQPAEEATV